MSDRSEHTLPQPVLSSVTLWVTQLGAGWMVRGRSGRLALSVLVEQARHVWAVLVTDRNRASCDPAGIGRVK